MPPVVTPFEPILGAARQQAQAHEDGRPSHSDDERRETLERGIVRTSRS